MIGSASLIMFQALLRVGKDSFITPLIHLKEIVYIFFMPENNLHG